MARQRFSRDQRDASTERNSCVLKCRGNLLRSWMPLFSVNSRLGNSTETMEHRLHQPRRPSSLPCDPVVVAAQPRYSTRQPTEWRLGWIPPTSRWFKSLRRCVSRCRESLARSARESLPFVAREAPQPAPQSARLLLSGIVLGSRSEQEGLSFRWRFRCGLARRGAVRLHMACKSLDAIHAAAGVKFG